MTFAGTTLAALSIAAVSAVVLSIEPAAVAPSTGIPSAATKSEQIMVAGRRRKCTEDLGYGRTGSYGCG